MASSDLALRGASVMTAPGSFLSPALIEIKDGRIVRVAKDDGQLVGSQKTRSLSGMLVIPGLVNTHAHLASVAVRGLGLDQFQTEGTTPGKELAARIREGSDSELTAAAVRLAVSELLASGVTTTTDSQAARKGQEDACDGALQAVTESGMRAIWYRASVDVSEMVPSGRHDTPELAVSELDRLHTRWSTDRVRVGAEAMALHRVTDPLLGALTEWADSGRHPFAMHISYSEMAADYATREHGLRLLIYLEDRGILNERFLGHHPVVIDDEEVEAAARSNAGFSWSPSANMLIGLRAAPVQALLGAGARLGLGTDQPNDSHNFFETMKAGVLQQRTASGTTQFGEPSQMLELATMGGARALHLEEQVGIIEVGKRADLAVIDTTHPTLNPRSGATSNLVYAAHPGVVESVYVDGELVLSDGRPTAWDVENVVAELDRLIQPYLQ